MTNKQAFECTHRGIRFRSRLEATWFEYLRLWGFRVIYEPEPFELVCVTDGLSLGSYLPDFQLITPSGSYYCEIKPLRERYGTSDIRSISRAYVLGYTHPTIVVLGHPMAYFAVLVEERYKGSPSGWVVEFWNSSEPTLLHHEDWDVAGFYPDENPDWEEDFMDPREGSSHRYYCGGDELASQATNATQWRRSNLT